MTMLSRTAISSGRVNAQSAKKVIEISGWMAKVPAGHRRLLQMNVPCLAKYKKCAGCGYYGRYVTKRAESNASELHRRVER
jgi:hypothetical protein